MELTNSDYLKLGHLVVEFLQQPSQLADAVRKVINLQPVGKDLVVSPLEDMSCIYPILFGQTHHLVHKVFKPI